MRLALLLAAAAVVGYLVGALSPATLLARRRGVDLAAAGSGNPGATNAARVLGRRVGLLVGLLDVAKGAVPAAVFGAIDGRAGMLAGFAAVLGHVSSPFLHGRGGRGVATSAGAVLGSQPVLVPVLLGVWAVVLLLTRWVALASMTAAASLPVAAYLLGYRGARLLWAAGLAAVVVVRHQANVRARLRRSRMRRSRLSRRRNGGAADSAGRG
jgi:acyl phosphate:glycerol-3-phosphate acyltransferase